jgi:hemerythrin-like domain-containing protein
MTHPFVQHLKKDHEKQRELGKKLRSVKAPEERKRLRNQFYEALYPHIMGEDASIFDYMESKEGKVQEQARKAMQEHHVGRVVLRELMELTLDSDIFNAKAYVLDELNRHHMDEEEKEHFPTLEREASKQQMDELFGQYKHAEKKAKS